MKFGGGPAVWLTRLLAKLRYFMGTPTFETPNGSFQKAEQEYPPKCPYAFMLLTDLPTSSHCHGYQGSWQKPIQQMQFMPFFANDELRGRTFKLNPTAQKKIKFS